MPSTIHSCPSRMCQAAHTMIVLLGSASLLVMAFCYPRAVPSLLILLALAVAAGLVSGEAAARSLRRPVGSRTRVVLAGAARVCDFVLLVLAAWASHHTFRYPNRDAACLVIGANASTAVVLTGVVAATCLWHVLHLQPLRPLR